MNFQRANPVNDARFEMLRAKLESALRAPAVIGFTSANADDGKEAAARGLADAFVLAGYATLLLDARVAASSGAYAAQRPTLEESGRSINAERRSGELCLLVVDDLFVQQKTSKRQIETTLSMLRTKFDYIVVDLDLGLTTAFAESMVQTVDAVFACVRKGRRASPADAQLALALDRIGEHFVGLVTLDPQVADTNPLGNAGSNGAHDWHPLVATVVDNPDRRRVVKWPT